MLCRNLCASAKKLDPTGQWSKAHRLVNLRVASLQCPRRLLTPPQSPDMNPIENLWSFVDREVHKSEITNKETFCQVFTVACLLKLNFALPRSYYYFFFKATGLCSCLFYNHIHIFQSSVEFSSPHTHVFGGVQILLFSITVYTCGLNVLITAHLKHWCLGKLHVYMFYRKLWGRTWIHEQNLKKILC